MNISELKLLRSICDSQISQLSFADFCSLYVHVEDVDSPTGETPFILWDAQKELISVLEEGARKLIVLKARQLGVTTTISTYCLWKAVMNPGFTGLILSDTDRQASEIVQQLVLVLESLPKTFIQKIERYRGRNISTADIWYENTATELRIGRRNGRRSRLVCRPSTAGGARSFTANFAIMDEVAFYEQASAVFDAVEPTVNRPNGGQLVLISTNKAGSLFDTIYRNKYSTDYPIEGDGWRRHFLSWRADPRRTDEWYLQTTQELRARGIAGNLEYPETEEDALRSATGLAFPEFDLSLHTAAPFPLTDVVGTTVCGYDPGYYDPAVLITCLVTATHIFVVDEFHVTQKTYAEQAFLFEQRLKRLISQGLPPPTSVITDRQAWAQTGKSKGVATTSIVDYFVNFKWSLVPSIKDRAMSKTSIHSWLFPVPTGFTDERGEQVTDSRLKIWSSCTQTISALSTLVCDAKDPDKVAASSKDHWFDALAYVLSSKAIPASPLPAAPKKTKLREYKERLAGTRTSRHVR